MFRRSLAAFSRSTFVGLVLSTFAVPAHSESFVIETIDAGDSYYSRPSIAVDDTYGVAVSYARWGDFGSFELCLASRIDGAWSVEVVDWGVVAHSLAFDPYGNPCIAYARYAPLEVKVATKWGGVAWGIETVEFIPDSEYETVHTISHAVSDLGVPHVAYTIVGIDFAARQNAAETDARYATRSENGWAATPVAPCYDYVQALLSLAITRDGIPGVAFIDNFNDVSFAQQDGPLWSSAEVGSASSAFSCSLEFDSEDKPLVGLIRTSDGVSHFELATKIGPFWSFDVIDPSPSTGFVSSLELDGAGNPWMSFLDSVAPGLAVLKLARFVDSEWILEDVVPTTFNNDSSTSLALDSSDSPWISYFDDATEEVRVARRSDAVSAPQHGPSGLVMGSPFPNPTRGSVTLSIQTDREEVVRTMLLDVSGRVVAQDGPRTILPGSEILRLDAPFAASGIYFMRVESPGSWSESRPVTLLR